MARRRSVVAPSVATRAGLIVLVAVFALGALWADRDLHDPVAGYGIIPQPGETSVPVPESGWQAGDPAPNFRLLSTEGTVVELADVRGTPVVLHFWTTWCLECASQMPTLQQHSADDGVRVFGIDVGETPGRVEEAASRNHITYEMLLDRDQEVAHYYGAWTYPVTIVIDANGVISAFLTGQVSADELQRHIEATRS